MELGLYTFGDIIRNPITGKILSYEERLKQMLELAVIADQAGLQIFGVGEHHGANFVNSATATTISAIAAVTKQIRLTSATTLISTADPVRTFQEFATADLVSGGRVELIFGRGAFTESFPLFGFNVDDYDDLFVEKLELFDLLNSNERVSWKGKFRPQLHDAEIAPRPVQHKLPVWIGAGSSGSIFRAATLGYPLVIPVLGGRLQAYAQLAKIYREVWGHRGRAGEAKIAVFSHLHIRESKSRAFEELYPYYSAYMEPLFKGPMPKEQYEQMLSPQGSLLAGGPQEVIDKLLFLKNEIGIARYAGQIDIGAQPFSNVVKGVELLASVVAPAVRKG